LDYKKFIVELSKLINNQNLDNQINENIFSPDDRFNRGKILFDQITLLGKILNIFKFKNQIISINNKFYIEVDGINLQIVSPYFLKGVGEEVHTSAKKICGVLDHFKTDNFYIDNLAISDKNGFVYITNGIGTMPQVQNYDPTVSNLVKVKAQTLSRFFQEKNIDYADVVKLDIEGHEPKLINDLLIY
jgi:hypothetical protein